MSDRRAQGIYKISERDSTLKKRETVAHGKSERQLKALFKFDVIFFTKMLHSVKRPVDKL